MFGESIDTGDLAFNDLLELKQRLKAVFCPDCEREIQTIIAKVASIDRRLETIEARVQYLGGIIDNESN